MAEPVTVSQLEVQLRLPAGQSGEAVYLNSLIVAARRQVEHYTNGTLVGDAPTITDADAVMAGQAILLLAAYWYDHRDAAGEMPPAVVALIWPLRRWSI